MPEETCQKLFACRIPDSPGDGAADDPPEQPPGDCSPSPDHQDTLHQAHETPKDEPQHAREQPPARLRNEAAQEQPLAKRDEEEGRSQVAPDKQPVERCVRVGKEAEKEGTCYSPKRCQYYPE